MLTFLAFFRIISAEKALGDEVGDWIVHRPESIAKLLQIDVAERIRQVKAWFHAVLPNVDPLKAEIHTTNINLLTRRDFDTVIRRMEYAAIIGIHKNIGFGCFSRISNVEFESFYPGFSKWSVPLEATVAAKKWSAL